MLTHGYDPAPTSEFCPHSAQTAVPGHQGHDIPECGVEEVQRVWWAGHLFLKGRCMAGGGPARIFKAQSPEQWLACLTQGQFRSVFTFTVLTFAFPGKEN